MRENPTWFQTPDLEAKSGATMRTDFLHFNGAVERDPAIDAWMKAHAGASCANHGQAFPNRIMEVLPTIVRNCFEPQGRYYRIIAGSPVARGCSRDSRPQAGHSARRCARRR